MSGLVLASIVKAQSVNWRLDGQTIYRAEQKKPEALLMINQWVKQNIADGYIFAGIDSVQSMGDSTTYFLYRGIQYKIRRSYSLSEDSGQYRKGSHSPSKILSRYLNNGYPFAAITTDSLYIISKKADWFFQIQTGPFITYDSLVFLTPIKSKSQFIARNLRLAYGMTYSELDYRLIESRIETMPYVSLNNAPDISFSGGKATIYLDLASHEVNSFDGVIGLQNNALTNEPELTGIVELSLQNVLQTGKQFYLKWNRFATSSQQLQTQYYQPFILRSPLGLDVSFQLLRQDTSFVNRQVDLNLIAGLAGTWQIGFSFSDEFSNVLSTALEQDRLTYRNQWYGILLFNRTQGFLIQSPGNRQSFYTKLMLGDKKITDTTSVQLLNFKYEVNFQYQRMIGGSKALYYQFRTGAIFNDQLVENEYFRIGGFKTLRGFNEQQFFSPFYFLQTTAFRFYTSDKSYFTVFNDSALTSGSSNAVMQAVFRSSLGTGFSLTVANGLFTFIFAQPILSDNPVSLLDARIHFGYTARF